MDETVRNVGVIRRIAEWPVLRWKIIAVAVGTVAGCFTALAVSGVENPIWMAFATLFVGSVGSGSVFALYVLLQQNRRLRNTEEQVRSLVNVRPLTGRLPIDFGEWAVDPVLADRVTRLLVKRRPIRVVECGSGWSTVLIASCLREIGSGSVVALEHLNRFAHQTRALLSHYGVSECAEVVEAPIQDVHINGESWPWYAVDPRQLLDGPVSLLVVDGPPGDMAPRSRYPAVPLFAEYLASNWAVLLDDGHRTDETWIAERWGQFLGVAPEFDPAGQGIFLLESWSELGHVKNSGVHGPEG